MTGFHRHRHAYTSRLRLICEPFCIGASFSPSLCCLRFMFTVSAYCFGRCWSLDCWLRTWHVPSPCAYTYGMACAGCVQNCPKSTSIQQPSSLASSQSVRFRLSFARRAASFYPIHRTSLASRAEPVAAQTRHQFSLQRHSRPTQPRRLWVVVTPAVTHIGTFTVTLYPR